MRPSLRVLAPVLALLLPSGLLATTPLPATAATVQDGITLSVDEDQVLAGPVTLTASDAQSVAPVTMSIDGEAVPATSTTPAATLQWQAHGWEAVSKNTFFINGDAVSHAPMARIYDWANGSWSIPAGVLHAGANTVQMRIGSASMVLDPATNANDDFNIRSVGIKVGSNAVVYDPAVAPFNKTIGMGDSSATALRTYTWTITLPDAQMRPTTSYAWDTDAADPGSHVVTATSGDGTRSSSATVRTGNVDPEPERVVLTPPTDASTAQSFTWRTGSGTRDGDVRIRPAGSDAEWRVVDAYANEVLTSGGVATRSHSATVTGLQPGTAYDYTVGNGEARSTTHRFTTAGTSGEPFTFLYFGDAQNDLTEKWAPVVDQAYETFPQAVGSVNAGDLIDASRNDSEWTEWFDAMGEHAAETNVIAAPGNHEFVGDTFLKNWKSAFEYDKNGPAYDGPAPGAEGLTDAQRQEAAYRTQIARGLEETAYYTDYQGVRFITLNAGRNEASSLYTPADLPSCTVDCPDPKQLWLDMQAEWLDHLLEDNPNRWTVATFHQPVFSTAVDRDEKDIRDTWLPVFQNRNIDLVLMGHDHTYARGFVNKDATSTSGMTRGPVYAVSVSGPKYYEQQSATDNVWTRNGATQVTSAGHTSTFQGITVDGDTLRYRSVVAAKWDGLSTTDVPVGGTLDSFTITKYASGAKRVTEDGVTPPATDPGNDTEPEDSGLEFSVPNGSVLSGIASVAVSDARSSEPLSVTVDGEEVATTPRSSRVNVAFEAHGYLATTKNTIIVNDTTKIVPATAYSGYATGRFQIPAGALHAGANKIEFWTGSAAMMNDPTPSANDDFNVRNLRLEFADGTTASDPAMAPTAIANLGDDGSNKRSWTWTVTVPEDKIVSGAGFTWDTTTEETGGTHALVATSADGTRSTAITVRVDNTEQVTLDTADGAVLHGDAPLTMTSDAPPTVTIEGARVPVELRRRVVDPVFAFEGDGFQPDAVMDSIWVNGELFRVLGVPEAAHGWKTVRVPIPWEELEPGTNTIRIRAGGNLSPTGDDADSFRTRNSRLVLAGDRVVRDPSYTVTQELSYGPGRRFWDFTVTVPDRFETVYQADWDTTSYDDGAHEVVVTGADGRGTATATVVLDNAGPAIEVGGPVDGHDYGTGELVVDASAADPHEVAALALKIDGETVQDGQTVRADELSDGEHTFVAHAVDGLGNVSEERVVFRSVGNLPKTPTDAQPSDGTPGIPPTGTDLGVRVTDPTGDAMDVDFKWAYQGDFSVGANAATQGSSTTAVPVRRAGSAVPTSARSAVAAVDGEALTTDGDAAYPFQQFEIEVPDGLEAGRFDVEWHGSVPATQRAALSVWNHRTQQWDLVAEGTGADLDLRGQASYADAVRAGKATVLVQDVQSLVIAENDDPAVWAWVSDTQFYSESMPSTYQKQMQWVLDNRAKERLGYAIHTGDIVNQKTLVEWERADQAQRMWDDAGMPYGIVPGNHDIDADGSYAMYQQFFGEDRYADNPWYGEGYEDNVQHYDIVSTPGADYLVVFLDWYQVENGDLDWADEVIKAHPDYNVIVATHQYTGESSAFINPGRKIWDQVINPNENVDAVLYGHIGIWLGQRTASSGRKVVEAMADYQSAPNYGDGWMRTVTFDANRERFSNRTFSVLHDRTFWKDDAKENFTVPMTLDAPERSVSTDYVGVTVESDAVVATVEDVASGTVVQAPTGVLRPDRRYSWYVEATDAGGHATTSPVWAFTTGADTVAPVLTVPGPAAVYVGDAFDPLAGVSATDDVDGALTAAVEVTGAVDLTAPGVYPLAYTVADTSGNETSQQRSVTVTGRFTPGTPSIDGAVRVGETLTARPGTWSHDPTLTYAWSAAGAPVAEGPSLVVTPALLGQPLTVTVTGTRAGYETARATSIATVVVAPGVLDAPVPTIGGTAQVDRVLSVDAGSWSPAATLGYQWYADGTAIPGATGASLTLTPALAGAHVTVAVTGSRTAYTTATRTSTATAAVARGVLDAPEAAIDGTPRVDETLTLTSGDWPAGVELTYRWLADGTAIAGADGTSLALTPDLVGAVVTAEVTGAKRGYQTATAVTQPTLAVAPGVLVPVVPRVTGTARVDRVLTVATGAWAPGTTLAVRWLADGRPVTGATSRTLTLAPALAGRAITAEVTGAKAGYATETVRSAATARVALGTLRGVRPRISGTAKVGKVLVAKAGTWSPRATLSYRWYADGKAIAGATTPRLKLTAKHAGDRITVRVTGTRAGYRVLTVASAATGAVKAKR